MTLLRRISYLLPSLWRVFSRTTTLQICISRMQKSTNSLCITPSHLTTVIIPQMDPRLVRRSISQSTCFNGVELIRSKIWWLIIWPRFNLTSWLRSLSPKTQRSCMPQVRHLRLKICKTIVRVFWLSISQDFRMKWRSTRQSRASSLQT